MIARWLSFHSSLRPTCLGHIFKTKHKKKRCSAIRQSASVRNPDSPAPRRNRSQFVGSFESKTTTRRHRAPGTAHVYGYYLKKAPCSTFAGHRVPGIMRHGSFVWQRTSCAAPQVRRRSRRHGEGNAETREGTQRFIQGLGYHSRASCATHLTYILRAQHPQE